MFRYTAEHIGRMQDELTRRSAALAKLSPWPDINYMVDESWARIHSYGSEAKSGEVVELQLRIMNHAPDRLSYRTKWNLPPGWKYIDGQIAVSIPARQEGTIKAGPHRRPRSARGHCRRGVCRSRVEAVDGGSGPGALTASGSIERNTSTICGSVSLSNCGSVGRALSKPAISSTCASIHFTMPTMISPAASAEPLSLCPRFGTRIPAMQAGG
jgi:hypothetical protein